MVPKDQAAKPEEKFSATKYPRFEAGKFVDEIFYPINELEDTSYSAFQANHKPKLTVIRFWGENSSNQESYSYSYINHK